MESKNMSSFGRETLASQQYPASVESISERLHSPSGRLRRLVHSEYPDQTSLGKIAGGRAACGL